MAQLYRSRWLLAAVFGALIGVPLLLFSGWNPDARFESSDAMWHDITSHIKGRGYQAITYDFNSYRSKCKRPDVTLVRTTPVAVWNIVGWPWYLMAPEWRVPYRAQRTCVARRCLFEGFPSCTGKDEASSQIESPTEAGIHGS